MPIRHSSNYVELIQALYLFQVLPWKFWIILHWSQKKLWVSIKLLLSNRILSHGCKKRGKLPLCDFWLLLGHSHSFLKTFPILAPQLLLEILDLVCVGWFCYQIRHSLWQEKLEILSKDGRNDSWKDGPWLPSSNCVSLDKVPLCLANQHRGSAPFPPCRPPTVG